MFGNLVGGLVGAAVGVVTSPLAVAADALTLGGALTDKDKPYTAEQIDEILENMKKALS